MKISIPELSKSTDLTIEIGEKSILFKLKTLNVKEQLEMESELSDFIKSGATGIEIIKKTLKFKLENYTDDLLEELQKLSSAHLNIIMEEIRKINDSLPNELKKKIVRT